MGTTYIQDYLHYRSHHISILLKLEESSQVERVTADLVPKILAHFLEWGQNFAVDRHCAKQSNTIVKSENTFIIRQMRVYSIKKLKGKFNKFYSNNCQAEVECVCTDQA